MLCGASPYIFVGRVLSAVSKDCRLTKPTSQCGQTSGKNDVQLRVEVTQILGIRPEAVRSGQSTLRVGQTIDPMTSALAAPYATIQYDEQGRLVLNAPYGALLPDERLRAAYVGRELLFAGGPSNVRVWALDKARWAQETMMVFSRMTGALSCHTSL